MDIREWLAPDGFLSFYHRNHPEHGKDFPDSAHHTGYWLMMEYILGTMSKQELRRILRAGLVSRWDEETGHFLRYPGSDEVLNRDQCMFLIPLLFEMELGLLANHLLKWHLDYKAPHWKDFWFNEDTWLGSVFEIGDAIADRVSKRHTSIVKNVARLSWNEFKGGDRNDCAWKHLHKAYDLNRSLEIYFSRRPATQEKDYVNLPTTPSILTPPPIYIPARKVLAKYG